MMTIDRPEVNPDGLYTQGQAAELLGVSRHTIARYEEDGCIKFYVRRAGRRKITTGLEILRCWYGVLGGMKIADERAPRAAKEMRERRDAREKRETRGARGMRGFLRIEN